MHYRRTTLSKFLFDQLRGTEVRDLGSLLVDVSAAIKAIAAVVSKGALGDAVSNNALGDAVGDMATINVQGEVQKKLDVLANEAVLRYCEWGGQIAGMLSEELEEPVTVPDSAFTDMVGHKRYLLSFDPLDGSSNIDVNVSVGTIFSVHRYRSEEPPVHESYLRPGHEQVAAGYAIYGPTTMLVLSVGTGTHGFTLDRETGNFVLTHPDLRIPEETSEFAINASNERFWEPPIQRYVSECKAGRTGVRERDFNMRWIASMVAEVHRILMRGGVFMYPRDLKQPVRPGRLRLLYEACPMGMLIEQAGGLASTGRQRICDVQPEELHQRVPVILGAKQEVERIERYHQEFETGEDQPYRSPLFNERSLYRNDETV